MEKQLTLKSEYNSLDALLKFVQTNSDFECSKEYDVWDLRTDSNGQMEQCVIIKKSAMHGMKVYFVNGQSLAMNYVVPNKVLNAYFGKSQKRYRNVLQILTGMITQAVLSGSQKKAFTEIEQVFTKIAA